MRPGDTEVIIPQHAVFYSNVGYEGLRPEPQLENVEEILRKWGLTQYIGSPRDTMLDNIEGSKVARKKYGFEGWVACGIPPHWSVELRNRQFVLLDRYRLQRGSVDLQRDVAPRLILRRRYEITAGYNGSKPYVQVNEALPQLPRIYEVEGESGDDFNELYDVAAEWLDQKSPRWRDACALW